MARPDKPLIHGLSRDELLRAVGDLGLPRFRADQLWRWLHVQRTDQWDAMANLPAKLRRELADSFELTSAANSGTNTGDAGTRKILAELRDGDAVEEVLIPAGPRRTVCVSTQVGCGFACSFCASGQAGFRRNLEAGEIVGQVLLAAREWGEKPTNVVYMGIGEPLDNYDAVLKSVRILNDDDGLNIGARRITISTCGLVPGIQRLATEGLQVELSVSLHAADDTLRSRLMPVNRTHPLDELLPACAAYTTQTRRIITFEYTLIGGVNDSCEQARLLAKRLSAFPCRVNLIPFSQVEEFGGRAGGEKQAEAFVRDLSASGVNATLRASRGRNVQAACGQLRFQEKHGGDGSHV